MGRVNPITTLLHQAIREGVFPGAVVFVRVHGEVVYHQAVGQMGQAPFNRPAHTETIYDLASLTKPLATSTAILCLVKDGTLSLDQPVKDWLSEWESTSYHATTVRHLLHHSSGLPAWRRYYEKLSTTGLPPKDEEERRARIERLVRVISQEPMEYEPGSQSVYSDLGFMALGVLIERCVGSSLAHYCRHRIYGDLNVNPLFFIDEEGNPTGGDGDLTQVAPTEQDPWRGRLIQADVHDENAYALGGIAGHAGLFGTALSVSCLSEAWLQSVLGGSLVFPQDLAGQFVRRQDSSGKSSWALGWDTPSPPSSSGRYFSPESFGHLGYAGTSLWIDPVRELEVVLLSNRVHPTRENKQIKIFRPELHDLVIKECIGDH
ncbi:serine hydrolase domain-containing protein [Candidatus Nitronereus thalassa]|uniref:Serine hydrolase n=1 Tax=Candidatus Nitronereus thalassa TaxID=3020898 RepID=A0ABU3KAD7_9BACT|nr:serine hydrolase [Candidatus Nitronereus thalassa]MDT7043354.1 serine hydrolase [Candidatus Nitronereus thalassa]